MSEDAAPFMLLNLFYIYMLLILEILERMAVISHFIFILIIFSTS